MTLARSLATGGYCHGVPVAPSVVDTVLDRGSGESSNLSPFSDAPRQSDSTEIPKFPNNRTPKESQ
jgi:hypothetical protein